MADPALSSAITSLPASVTAMPLTAGTIQTSNVPIVELPQTTPSVGLSGSAEGVSILPFVSRTAELQVQSMARPQMTRTALLCMALRYTAMQAPAMQALAMQFTAMPSMVTPSIMTTRPNQLGFVSAPLNVQGTRFPGSSLPNPGWQLSPREQMLQDQLHHECQQFEA